ncbi:hypothetical protein THER5_1953 [Bifidobacterium thermacidophilum subsp. thermacidophilum]|uniref:Uncharacterized protein n=1 Tax=Bifidobacterium thermacidophilum subsp. thermacidophilum TaxID=79262 RepID=A0A087E996_9BIFI|nr:hypothetical protein THER5_1953 [Bifidobacterium thermacidophilum subsp. thermacidophilum]
MRTQTGDATEAVSVDSLNSYSNWLRQDRRERRRFVNGRAPDPNIRASCMATVRWCRPCRFAGRVVMSAVHQCLPCAGPSHVACRPGCGAYHALCSPLVHLLPVTRLSSKGRGDRHDHTT